MDEETEQLRLTQPLTDATAHAIQSALTTLGDMTNDGKSVDAYFAASVQLDCTKALCYELAGLRAQMALHRLEMAEVSTELSDLRLKL